MNEEKNNKIKEIKHDAYLLRSCINDDLQSVVIK